MGAVSANKRGAKGKDEQPANMESKQCTASNLAGMESGVLVKDEQPANIAR